jgi:hypothetical protein
LYSLLDVSYCFFSEAAAGDPAGADFAAADGVTVVGVGTELDATVPTTGCVGFEATAGGAGVAGLLAGTATAGLAFAAVEMVAFG